MHSTPMSRLAERWLLAAAVLAISATAAAADPKPPLRAEDGIIVWETKAGRQVRIDGLRLTQYGADAAGKRSIKLEAAAPTVQGTTATWQYAGMLDGQHHPIAGSARLEMMVSDKASEDALTCRWELKFDEPLGMDVGLQCVFAMAGPPPGSVFLPEISGRLTRRVLSPGAAERGKFELGAGAASLGGCDLGMPVVDFCWDQAGQESRPLRLAVAADPYCGCSIAGDSNPVSRATAITISTIYKGSLVPITTERRTISLEFHRRGVDGSLGSFYRTIPEIKPGPAWTKDIHLAYYDYLSEQGEGWFKDLQTLADRIPLKHRGHVVVCEHGWYDYFQQYAYDHQHKKLLDHWTAFPGTRKIPMSLEEMHRRLKFAKGLGFRTLLYFADGTNSDSGAPNFRKEYVLRDKAGKSLPGWKGPDSIGDPVKMDPSVPGLRDWYRGYLAALLDEYAQDLDGFVWDETFYIPPGFVSYTMKSPAYADRAMMRLTAELVQMVQDRQRQNPDLVFLAADCGAANYALVAHGAYQDSDASTWGRDLFPNYRNCLWICNWSPVSGGRNNAAERFGLPQGVSNGWEDSRGPHNMPAKILDQVLCDSPGTWKTPECGRTH